MRLSLILLPLLIAGCTGSLTEEQRKKVKEDMANHQIRKVSEAEIVEAAYSKGRKWIAILEEIQNDSSKIDSILKANEGRITWAIPGSKCESKIEQELLDAYAASNTADLQDNVQKIRTTDGISSDSILYSKPVAKRASDGKEKLAGVWNIWLSRKKLIMEMK